MTKNNRVIVVSTILVLGLFGMMFYLFRLYIPLYLDYLMPLNETAWMLVHDRKMGGAALTRGLKLGEPLLLEVKQDSKDFNKLDNRTSVWIAKLLAESPSPLALQYAEELYARNEKRQKLVGAVALAGHNKLGDMSYVVSVWKNPTDFQDDEDLARMALEYKYKRPFKRLRGFKELPPEYR